MKVIVCIPTYNERDSIAETIRGICDLNREKLSVIVIDDNSPDGTSDIVEEISKFHPDRVMLIKRERKLGLGSAYNTGFQFGLLLAVYCCTVGSGHICAASGYASGGSFS